MRFDCCQEPCRSQEDAASNMHLCWVKAVAKEIFHETKSAEFCQDIVYSRYFLSRRIQNRGSYHIDQEDRVSLMKCALTLVDIMLIQTFLPKNTEWFGMDQPIKATYGN
jgi:hypothetical protein